jgi:hypothetical protein
VSVSNINTHLRAMEQKSAAPAHDNLTDFQFDHRESKQAYAHIAQHNPKTWGDSMKTKGIHRELRAYREKVFMNFFSVCSVFSVAPCFQPGGRAA